MAGCFHSYRWVMMAFTFAAIGAYLPCVALEIPLKIGLITLGRLPTCMVAFFYSLINDKSVLKGVSPEQCQQTSSGARNGQRDALYENGCTLQSGRKGNCLEP
ncbi:MAG: hypothetical protein LBQ81_02690 [Zoogloeaceae bacterium]|jgi:hypothetical protein|nr:hypothetical protein [Zoogloeaceae bacterium]